MFRHLPEKIATQYNVETIKNFLKFNVKALSVSICKQNVLIKLSAKLFKTFSSRTSTTVKHDIYTCHMLFRASEAKPLDTEQYTAKYVIYEQCNLDKQSLYNDDSLICVDFDVLST